MSLVYALVSRGSVVLAEYTDQAGNFPTVTRVLLNKIDTNKPGKTSIVYDQFMFHYLTDNHLTFLCMTDNPQAGAQRVRVPYMFLEDVKNEFIRAHGDSAQKAIAFELNEAFAPVLEAKLKHFNAGGEADKFNSVNAKLDAVKDVMIQNIEQVLERGEKLELLVDKTDELSNSAFVFQKQSKKLKNAMYWKKIKMYMLITFVVVLIIWIISVVACGITYKKCK